MAFLKCVQHFVDRLQGVPIRWQLVFTPSQDSWKADRDARFMTRRLLDRFKTQLENKLSPNGADWPKFFDSVVADEPVHLANFCIGEARICLCKRNQLLVFPYRERIIGE